VFCDKSRIPWVRGDSWCEAGVGSRSGILLSNGNIEASQLDFYLPRILHSTNELTNLGLTLFDKQQILMCVARIELFIPTFLCST